MPGGSENAINIAPGSSQTREFKCAIEDDDDDTSNASHNSDALSRNNAISCAGVCLVCVCVVVVCLHTISGHPRLRSNCQLPANEMFFVLCIDDVVDRVLRPQNEMDGKSPGDN